MSIILYQNIFIDTATDAIAITIACQKKVKIPGSRYAYAVLLEIKIDITKEIENFFDTNFNYIKK